MMITPRPEDARHRTQLYRVLSAIADNPVLARKLCFKGGTCAAMLGFLDRFSVDLDFELSSDSDLEVLREQFYQVFKDLDLEIKDESQETLQFFLRYPNPPDTRNTLKIDAVDTKLKAAVCEVQYLTDIDRYLNAQTIESMFAHKLVALKERYERNQTIAGRDLYDIHHFFEEGHRYEPEIIRARRKSSVAEYLKELIIFIEENITQTVIQQDLNLILPADKFRRVRKTIKNETLMLLRNELTRLTA